jgi:hypothetical protein
MSSFFKNISKGVGNVESEYLGPDYSYSNNIIPPSGLGVSSTGDLDSMVSDVDALVNYVKVLVSGGGDASKADGPLGNKYFLKTSGQCKDEATGSLVDRYIYVNNVPSGHIPGLSTVMQMDFSSLEGIVPGIVEDLGKLDPLPLFSAFMQGSNPPCQEVTMEVGNAGNLTSQSQHLANSDLSGMDPCSFPNKTNPVTNASCVEAFISANEHLKGSFSSKKKRKPQLSKTASLYTGLVGLLVAYLIYRVTQK